MVILAFVISTMAFSNQTIIEDNIAETQSFEFAVNQDENIAQR